MTCDRCSNEELVLPTALPKGLATFVGGLKTVNYSKGFQPLSARPSGSALVALSLIRPTSREGLFPEFLSLSLSAFCGFLVVGS